ncbi:MAG TPA: DnaJ domain-containing protein [Gaiellaceae bacterium]|nr:DnaJ domain-containing protein [Gaiellaceae bacterium]
MRLEQDYYDVLGVARGATDEEIKRAFRGLARRLHPDVAPVETTDGFHAVLEAYRVLSHPKRRRLYDRLGLPTRRREDARPAPAVPPVELRLEWWEAERGASKPVEIEETAMCAECLGRGVPRGVAPALCVACRGAGHRNVVRETSELRLLEVHRCVECEGRGHVAPPTCERCGGTGRTAAETTIRVRVPAGVQDGDLLQVDGIAQRFRLEIAARPRDSRAVLAGSAAALLGALALLLYLVVQ